MKQAVLSAAENFCSTILSTSLRQGRLETDNFYGAAVSLYENEAEHIWYLLFQRETLNQIAQNLLFEDSLCEDDLDDLIKEVSNQIIGGAKVILQQKYPNHTYQLSVPEFMGHISHPFPFTTQETLCYSLNDFSFVIAHQ